MKNYKEIVESVFERKEQYETDKRKKRKILTRTLTPICCICLVALLGIGAWHCGLFKKQPIQKAEDAIIPGTKDWYGPGESEPSTTSNDSNENNEITSDQSNIKDNTSNNESTTTIAVLQSGNVDIFFVNGNKILSEQIHLSLSPKNIFSAWKEKNGIGDEVKLIDVNIESNGKETINNSGAESTVAEYQIGNYFIYNLTVSKDIENYYGKKNSEILLNSLKKTMTEFYTMNFNEYNLILK